MEFLNNTADNATFYAGLQGLYALSIKYEFQQTKPNQCAFTFQPIVRYLLKIPSDISPPLFMTISS